MDRMVWALVAAFLTADAWAGAPRTAALNLGHNAGSESCISGEETVSRVEAALGRQVFFGTAPDLAIDATVERSAAAPQWRAIVRVRDKLGAQVGYREISSGAESCDPLGDALVLVVTLMIDPTARVRVAKPPPPASPTTVPPAMPIAPPQQTPPPTTQTIARAAPAPVKPRWGLQASVGPTLAVGLLPGAALGVSPQVTLLSTTGLLASLQGTVLATKEQSMAAGEAEFGLWEVALSACPARGVHSSWRLGVCGGVAMARVTGSGRGFEMQNLAQASWVVSVTLGLRLARVFGGSWVTEIDVRGTFPTQRTEFYYLDSQAERERIYQIDSAVVLASLQLGWLYRPWR